MAIHAVRVWLDRSRRVHETLRQRRVLARRLYAVLQHALSRLAHLAPDARCRQILGIRCLALELVLGRGCVGGVGHGCDVL